VSRIEVRRPVLEGELRARVEAGSPFLFAGPRGAGKTTLLLRLARALEKDGWSCLYLDLMGAASSPDRFVLAALDALPAERFGDLLREATEIRRLLASGRPQHAQAVRSVMTLWASLDRALGRPVALFLDEATEIRSLAYFPGLREIDRLLVSALASRVRGTVLATSFPTLAEKAFGLPVLRASALDLDEVGALLPAGNPASAEDLLRASFGWAGYLRVLLERLRDGVALRDAWTGEMEKGGRLELLGHHTYETLLLRSRGYGISKAALAAVAHEEGLNLKSLVARLGRTPGATRDYLQWLVGVDALRMDGKRYFYVDGMVRQWVRLHGTGQPASAADVRRALETLLEATLPADDTPSTEWASAAEPEGPAEKTRRARHDTLMEID
jgi:DNA polymerase III delta prime subunit